MIHLLLALFLSVDGPSVGELPKHIYNPPEPVFGVVLNIDPTTYNPALGGINCDDKCEQVLPGTLAQPPEYPDGTLWVLWDEDNHSWGTWVGHDNGCAIITQPDGTVRLDLYYPGGLPRVPLYGVALRPLGTWPEEDTKREARMRAWRNICEQDY